MIAAVASSTVRTLSYCGRSGLLGSIANSRRAMTGSSTVRGFDQGVRWWGMHRALLVLTLITACHQDKPPVAPSAPSGPRTLTVTTDVPLDVTVFGPDRAKQTVI